MISKKYKLAGLTCSACAKLIQLKLDQIKGLKNISISDNQSEMELVSDREIGLEEISELLKDTNYKVFQF